MLNKYLLTKVFLSWVHGYDVTKCVFVSSLPEIH